MSKINDAIMLAVLAHKNDMDKAGLPVILHPIRVMGSFPAGTDEDTLCVAILHDVVEDTDVTLDQIEAAFGKTVRDAVDAVTRRADETYSAFVERAAKNFIGRKVKIKDIMDNLKRLTPELKGLEKRYQRALSTLTDKEYV